MQQMKIRLNIINQLDIQKKMHLK